MPLPTKNMPWPPKALAQLQPSLDAWATWYDGSPEALRALYQKETQPLPHDRPSQYRNGVQGALARFWWGRPLNLTQQRFDQSHIPIAADMCQTSADLLYAEPPQFIVEDDAQKKAIDALTREGLHNTLATGAELGAALGGRYHRVTWDKDLADQPFLTTVDAERAWPEFQWGHLVAVTFWSVLERRGTEVVRMLERHELEQGFGLVYYGLYVGTEDKLGRQAPLEEHPATAGLEVDENGALLAGRSKGLQVAYIPNQSPQRRKAWRHHEIGQYLGRSDLDGVEGLMDNLDEAFSSWMRDIRLAKGRVFIPEYMLGVNGPGQGATWDADQEAYVPVKSAAPEDADANITINQFSIRVEEHERTCDRIINEILRTSGYSAQTFGEIDGAAVTATEITARERRSYLTRDRKTRVEGPAVSRLLFKMMQVNADIFGGTAPTEEAQVVFGDAVQESPLTIAQTVQTLDAARAASTRVKVQMVHPDWDETRVDNEVADIEAANAPAPVVDPFSGV